MELRELIKQAAEKKASDIHLVQGLKPVFRIDGELRVQEEEQILTKEQLQFWAGELQGEAFLYGQEEAEVAVTVEEVRVRGSLFWQQGRISAALRILKGVIPSLKELGLPLSVKNFTLFQKGLVLITGETGSGKSTTLAAVLEEINHQRAAHVITLEDPVEYIYAPDKCVFNQRQVGQDTESFSRGLRASLRQDPDILLIGEMRDRETMETALVAAQTGHLVFATLHTNSAVEAVDRLVGAFPPYQQPQIRLELSLCLQAVAAQQLLPSAKGRGREAACEVMMVTPAIRNLIREGKTPQIFSAMLSGGAAGSMTMDNCLLGMVREGRISSRTALEAGRDREYLGKMLREGRA